MKLTKFCRYCQAIRPTSDFSIRRASADGLAFKCRDCSKAYRASRKTEYAAVRKAHYERNKDQERAAALKRYANNRDAMRKQHLDYMARTTAQQRQYRLEKKHEYLARTAAYRAALDQRTPKWLTVKDLKAIARIYECAKVMSDASGIPHHVDHIVPLRGKKVSGLHVPWNLQAIPAILNISKGNKHE